MYTTTNQLAHQLQLHLTQTLLIQQLSSLTGRKHNA